MSAGVGVAVTLECLAIGNLIQSISWNRDFESLQNGKVLTVYIIVRVNHKKIAEIIIMQQVINNVVNTI